MTQDHSREALYRARTSQSLANYAPIIAGFAERGLTDIRPRENVLTYQAWLALGRQVRRGEHGVRVQTWITVEKDGQKVTIPKTTTVFHITQTDPKGD
jgi:hypothetical protein